jgi:hypothetical protein
MTLSKQAEQDERRALVKSTSGFTYASWAASDIAAETGRHKTEVTVVGSQPAVYPRPPSGPWSGADPVPPEPSLGYSVDDQEPTGSYQEIQRSLDRLARASSTETSSPSVGDPPATPLAPGDVGAGVTASSGVVTPSSFPRRRFT